MYIVMSNSQFTLESFLVSILKFDFRLWLHSDSYSLTKKKRRKEKKERKNALRLRKNAILRLRVLLIFNPHPFHFQVFRLFFDFFQLIFLFFEATNRDNCHKVFCPCKDATTRRKRWLNQDHALWCISIYFNFQVLTATVTS